MMRVMIWGLLQKLSVVIAVWAWVLGVPAFVDAQTTLKLLGWRYPVLEYYQAAMGNAPGVKIEATLMPADQYQGIATLTLSGGSSSYDIIWANEAEIQDYASKGWLEPLDQYIDKYKSEYQFADMPDSLFKNLRYNGKLYGLPISANLMFFFYRKDIFDQRGIKPPTTFADYLEAAKALTTTDQFGTTISLKRGDAALNEFHWYLNAHGGKWFDARWKPTFNSPEGVRALETLKEMMKYAPPGVTSYANDESTIALQQGVAVMGLQWASRAAAMDNPQTSKVVGKIEWAVPPRVRADMLPGQRIVTDSAAISKFSAANKDLIFRTLAYASSREKMRGAAKLSLPTRSSLLTDAELAKQNRFWPAALAAMRAGQPYPLLPEFYEMGDGVTLKIQQAVTGQLSPKQALDEAAKEAEDFLRSHGYYK